MTALQPRMEIPAVQDTQLSFVRSPGFAERAIAVVTMFVYAFSLPNEWFVIVGENSAGAVQGGSPITTLAFLSFGGFAVLSLNGNWHLAVNALGREPLFAVFVGWVGLSSIWSLNAAETFSAFVLFVIALVISANFLVRYRLEEILYLCGVALAIGIAINFIFIFVFQEFGTDSINVGTDGGSRWSGVFVTKNELGRVAVLSLIVCGYLTRVRRSRFIWPFWSLLALIQIIGSDAGTALGATFGVFALTAVMLGFRGRKTLYGATAVAMATIFSILTLLAATNLAAATGLLGKDATFTGRAPLWLNTIQFGIAERPWFGYGWLAFWTEDVAIDVKLRSNFLVPNGHNTFLDAWLFAGPIAAFLLIAIFLRGFIWGARNIRAVPSAVGLAPVILISYAFIYSLAESGVVRRELSFIVLVVACSTVAQNKGVKVKVEEYRERRAEQTRAGTR